VCEGFQTIADLGFLISEIGIYTLFFGILRTFLQTNFFFKLITPPQFTQLGVIFYALNALGVCPVHFLKER